LYPRAASDVDIPIPVDGDEHPPAVPRREQGPVAGEFLETAVAVADVDPSARVDGDAGRTDERSGRAPIATPCGGKGTRRDSGRGAGSGYRGRGGDAAIGRRRVRRSLARRPLRFELDEAR